MTKTIGPVGWIYHDMYIVESITVHAAEFVLKAELLR